MVLQTDPSAARFDKIELLLTEWSPCGLVVGLPRYPDGADHPFAPRCRRFANQLRGHLDCPWSWKMSATLRLWRPVTTRSMPRRPPSFCKVCSMPRSIQLNARGELTHLLSTEGLPRSVVLGILDHAKDFLDLERMEVRNADLLAGKSIFNLFLKTPPAPAPPLKSLPRSSRPMLSISMWAPPRQPRESHCSTPSTTWPPCGPTCLWCGTPRLVHRTSLPGTSTRLPPIFTS
jgi:Predicted endonuclease involved in recombination (possible Holliday junction resolvase in Mycoplasmas and B. subtilis)